MYPCRCFRLHELSTVDIRIRIRMKGEEKDDTFDTICLFGKIGFKFGVGTRYWVGGMAVWG